MSFAYLVAMNIAENAWREIVGTPLTIPLYFPRNAAARDELMRLTDAFVAGGFSNLALLRAIVTSPAFNLSGPEDACWKKPYPAPALFDPWTFGFGVCDNPGAGPSTDFIDDLRTQANALPGASARDLVVALKDRLIGEPSIDEGTERFALEALLGSGLDDTLASAVESTKRRALCGALLSTPQMLLSGATPRDATDVPSLTPPKGLYGAFCNDFNGDPLGDYLFGCSDNQVTVEQLTKMAQALKP